MQEVGDELVYGARRASGAVVGTTVNFFDVVHVEIARGRALAAHDDAARSKVCVIGEEVALILEVAEVRYRVLIETLSGAQAEFTVAGIWVEAP